MRLCEAVKKLSKPEGAEETEEVFFRVEGRGHIMEHSKLSISGLRDLSFDWGVRDISCILRIFEDKGRLLDQHSTSNGVWGGCLEESFDGSSPGQMHSM